MQRSHPQAQTASPLKQGALAASVALLAQQDPPLALGDRVRVTAPDVIRGRVVGSVVALSADTCVVKPEGRAQVALPLASVTSLEVSRERKSNVGKGAGLGLLIGGAARVLTGFIAVGAVREGADAGDAAPIAAMGAGAGLLIGSAIGTASSRERWEAVPLDRLRVGVVQGRNGGLAIRVSLAF